MPSPDWPLPRPPEYFLDRILALHRAVRDGLWQLAAHPGAEDLCAAREQRGGDTIFALDVHAEEIIEPFFVAWGEELPLAVVMEGFPGDGLRVFPAGLPRDAASFTCVIDPIDGTRGLMYGKRSGWILTGLAPGPGHGQLTLNDIALAVQTELPTPRSHLSDMLWAMRGGGVRGETHNLESGTVRSFSAQPSTALTLRHGFATVSKFFPGSKVAASLVEERLAERLFGPPVGDDPQIFDDEYISTGGQLYELMIGHDRLVADLRPLLPPTIPGSAHIPTHPYDLCTELIAREVGVIVTDAEGGPLRYPLDTHTGCAWIGYANEDLRRGVEPHLREIVAEVRREM